MFILLDEHTLHNGTITILSTLSINSRGNPKCLKLGFKPILQREK